MPVGPPQKGTEGLTFAASAGSTFTSARSLYAHVLASVVPRRCSVIHELYTSVPWPTMVPSERRLPLLVKSTGVPSGTEAVLHPFVSVELPVPAQWAA